MAVKDSKKIQQANLKKNVVRLIEILKVNPFQTPPPYEKLVGDLTGAYSRRIKKEKHQNSFVRKCSLRIISASSWESVAKIFMATDGSCMGRVISSSRIVIITC